MPGGGRGPGLAAPRAPLAPPRPGREVNEYSCSTFHNQKSYLI
jgi:hypothetical protein